ncbi:alanine racemase [Ahrensia sp. R2A130]|uniref:alanine racemase n=1 Tax=Ahrensia sp. R2A130 TaxID=744979 RepID=UPI0001E09C1C|nr:alanine racemase [Ahrensia sp. R2A130]EFL90619.1 alanine racemase [Ahrensia sp. R2A130]
MDVIDEALAGGRVTIDLDALKANYTHLAKLAAPAECGAVVKANGYGCGIEVVVPALWDAGCRTFFVAVSSEGLRVMKTAPDARCFILNGLFTGAENALADAGLIPCLGSVTQIENWAATAKQRGTPLPCAIHMDSGMNRLGLSYDELARTVEQPHLMDHLDVQLFMTHYACADDIGHPQTEAQRERFLQGADLLPGVPRSAANSAADLQATDHTFDLARPGIALYGGEALNDVDNPMRPVVTLEGRVVQTRWVERGGAVGYGASETMTRRTRLAYVSTGYADGYHRAASNFGVPMRFVAPAAVTHYKGHTLKGVGRISMDLAAFDVTDMPDDAIGEGDWIELFGNNVPVDDVARAAGTIGYELLTGLGARYARKIIGG